MSFYVPQIKPEALDTERKPIIRHTRIVEKIDYTDKGILVYYENCSYPQKGFPLPEALASIASVKRLIILLLSFFLKPHKIKQNCKKFIDFASYQIKPYKLKSEYYCPAAKEIERTLKVILNPKDDDYDYIGVLIQIIKNIIQYDNAYRYRLQDILGNIRGYKIKEIKRLLSLWEEREINQSQKDKIRMIKRIFAIAVLIPKIRKLALRFIKTIDCASVELDEGDYYFCLSRNDYNYRGFSYEYRKQFINPEDRVYQVKV